MNAEDGPDFETTTMLRGMKMNVESPAVSATESNFQDLQENLKRINELIYQVTERISPILFEIESKATPIDPSSKNYPGPTGVSDRLGMLCRETDSLGERLNALLRRIDL